MTTISLLVELQNLDLASDENARQRAVLETQLSNSAGLNTARAELDTTQAHVNTLQSQLRDIELETGALTEKLKQVNERLYSGRINNAKELAGLNEDERMLQRRKSELEDRALALMEQIESADANLDQKRTAHDTTANETNTRHDKERTALQKLDASDADIARKRDAVCAQLDAPTLRMYEQLRASKRGRALAHIKYNACGGCGYAVPGGLISRVKAGTELVTCTNCGRIIAP